MPKDILKKYLTGLLAVIITIAVCTFLWFVLIHFINLHITLSVGIASGSDADDVVKLADENLYTAKTTGKDRVVSSIKQ